MCIRDRREDADHGEHQCEFQRHAEHDAKPGAQADLRGRADVVLAQAAAMQQLTGDRARERADEDAEWPHQQALSLIHI